MLNPGQTAARTQILWLDTPRLAVNDAVAAIWLMRINWTDN